MTWGFGCNVLVDVSLSGGSRGPVSTITKQLKAAGAEVATRYKKGQTTHIIFKGGNAAQARAAEEDGCAVVSVLWLDQCVKANEHLDEAMVAVMAMIMVIQ